MACIGRQPFYLMAILTSGQLLFFYASLVKETGETVGQVLYVAELPCRSGTVMNCRFRSGDAVTKDQILGPPLKHRQPVSENKNRVEHQRQEGAMAKANLFATNRRSSIGIVGSGEQHKELLGLIDSFVDSIHQGRIRESRNLILLRFVDYAIYHFRKDAELIEKYGYDDYLVQYRMEQRSFARELDELRRRTRLPSFVADDKTVSVLKEILNHHLTSNDRYLVRRADNG